MRWQSVRASTSGVTEPDEYDWPESRRDPVPACTRLIVAIDGTYVQSKLDTDLYQHHVVAGRIERDGILAGRFAWIARWPGEAELDQAVGQERDSVSGQSPRDHQGEPLGEAGNPDCFAQPHDQGLGQLPSARRRKDDVRGGGFPHSAGALALGAA